MNLKKRIEKIKRNIKITTATAAPAPIFERAKACSYTLTVNVLVPAFPPVRRKMSSNLLKVQINLNIKRILKNAIKLGGTTIKDHIQPDGNLGYFKHYLKVYGRTNDKCVECDGKIKEIKQLGRSSFFCGSCQR